MDPLIISQNGVRNLTDHRIHVDRIDSLDIRMFITYPADGTEHMLHRLA